MTENQVKKLVGKRVRIVKHIFPHSVEKEIIEGIVDYEIVMWCGTYRNKWTQKEHVDMLIENKNKIKTIAWNNLRLIVSCEVID